MRRTFLILAALLAVVSGLFAAFNWTPATLSSRSSHGRILLWHTLNGQEAEALSGIIAKFRELNPGSEIKTESFESQEAMLLRLRASLDLGLGPDVVLGAAQWTPQLADSGAITSIDTLVDDNILQRYAPATLEMLRYDGNLYGLPEALSTMGLYYNRRLTDNIPTTLDDLMAQSAAGNTVLMGSTFFDSFWGIQAFGGKLFDEDGRAILGQGGFANWLAWLKSARDAPGVILDANREVLRSRFMENEAAYYIGEASELNTIIEALGEDNVGVAPLPSGPTGNAGPFLRVQSFMFSTNSSPTQQATAIAFATFATNVEQSSVLMRLARHVPANAKVRVNQRLNPSIAAFATQARSAVPVPNIAQMSAVWSLGGDAVTMVLEGVMEPAQAAFSTAVAINEANGFEVGTEPVYTCTEIGSFRLVHTLEDRASQALDQIVAKFKAACPLIIVQYEFDTPENIAARFDPQAKPGARPHLILAPHYWLGDEANSALVQDIATQVTADSLQRFRPGALDAMRSTGTLRGLPFAMDLDALYYNRAMIAEPARLLTDLRIQAAEGLPVLLDRDFEGLFWGTAATGGPLFDAAPSSAFRTEAFASWLLWLHESQEAHNIRILEDHEEAIRLFTAGESAYLVGSPTLYPRLVENLGNDALGIVPLPAGPAGDAGPLATVYGFMVGVPTNAALTRLALQFSEFATSAASEELVLQTARLVPANAAVNSEAATWLSPWTDQLPHAVTIPVALPIATLAAQMRAAYTAVLNAGSDPYQTAVTAAAAINRVLGVQEVQEEIENLPSGDTRTPLTPTPTTTTSTTPTPATPTPAIDP